MSIEDPILTPLTLEEYQALGVDERLARGAAAERSRRRWRESAACRELSAPIYAGTAACAENDGRERLTLDHITPLVRGGTHLPTNIRILCGSCNSRKKHH